MTGRIHISYAGRDVVNSDFSILTSRSVKTVFANFQFDSEWDEFPTKTAIFVSGNVVKSQILTADNLCEVPWEVLVESGTLTIGIVGQNGEKIFPSVEANVPVLKGIYAEGTAPQEPSPDIYQQIVRLMQETQAIAQSVRNDAENGKFNGPVGPQGPQGEQGPKGENGADGEKGYTPQRGADYWTEEDIAEIKSYVDNAILGGEW